MVRTEVLRKRLNKLDEYLDILRRLQRYEMDERINDRLKRLNGISLKTALDTNFVKH
jgi:hypothetical protein